MTSISPVHVPRHSVPPPAVHCVTVLLTILTPVSPVCVSPCHSESFCSALGYGSASSFLLLNGPGQPGYTQRAHDKRLQLHHP